MKQFDAIRVLLILVLITSVPVFFYTNSASAQESPSEEPNDLQQLSANQLGIWIAPLTAEQLRSLADVEMARLRETSNRLAIAIVQQLRIHANEDADTSEIDARVTELLAARNQITPRVNVVLDALKAKGGDIAGDIAYVKEVERLSPQVAPPAAQASAKDLQEAQLAASIAAAIATVRELPPVHERDSRGRSHSMSSSWRCSRSRRSSSMSVFSDGSRSYRIRSANGFAWTSR